MRPLLYFLIALSPLPLASVGSVWQWFWVLVVGLMALFISFKIYRSSSEEGTTLSSFPKWIISLCTVFIAWGFIQAAAEYPFLPTDPRSLAPGVTSTLALNPFKTQAVAAMFASHFLLFVMILASTRNSYDSLSMLKFIGHVTSAYAIYGIYAHFSDVKMVLWFDKWTSGDSLTSTFVNRNNFATYCGLGLCVVVGQFQALVGNGKLAFGSKRLGRLDLLSFFGGRDWWLIVELLVLLTALMLTASRAGIVASLVAILLLVVVGARKKQGLDARDFYFVGIFIACMITALLLSSDVFLRRLELSSLDSASRIEVYSVILNILKDGPFLGSGLGGFEDVFRLYRPPSVDGYFSRAHNEYLELAVTAGLFFTLILIFGILSCLVFIGRQLKSKGRSRQLALTGLAGSMLIGVHSLVDFPTQIPAVSYLYLVILATSVQKIGGCDQD